MSKRQRVECSCRFRNAGTPVEKFRSDDVRPVLDAINGFCQLRDVHTEGAITLLPAKVAVVEKSGESGR